MKFLGEEIKGRRPSYIHNAGMARTYQIINLFADMPVIDNVIVGMHDSLTANFFDSLFHTKKHREEEAVCKERALELLDFVGLKHRALRGGGKPSLRRASVWSEIVRGLASNPKLLLLDEPAAGMNSTEKRELDATCKRIVERWNLSILLVEHDMDLVMGVSDYIYVLSFGSKLAEGKPEEIQSNPAVIEAYLGGDE